MNTTDTITIKCSKCEGTGRIAAFAGIDGGRCWQCGGAGSRQTTEAKEQRNKAARARRAAKQEADREARLDARIRAIAADCDTFEAYHDERCSGWHKLADYTEVSEPECVNRAGFLREWEAITA